MNVLLGSARARAAVLACKHQGLQQKLMRLISREARKLKRAGAEYAVGEGLFLEAAMYQLRGNDDRAVELLLRASEMSLRAELLLNGNAMLRARGRIMGGDEGAAHMATAEEYFRSQGLENVDAIENIFAPGFQPT